MSYLLIYVIISICVALTVFFPWILGIFVMLFFLMMTITVGDDYNKRIKDHNKLWYEENLRKAKLEVKRLNKKLK